MNKVFISYVKENTEIVDRLYQELKSYGIQVWLDRKDLAPGLRWKREIRRAIQQGAFFIACFSKEYDVRDRTYMNEELTIAIEELRQRPVDQAWFIPIKLNECEIPDRDIGGGETLRDLQYVNLYDDWDGNLQRILKIVQPESPETINVNTIEQSVDLNAEEEFFKGLTYQNRRNYGKAVEHYTEALRLNPQLVGAYINRGNVYNSKAEHDLAIVDYNKAIQLKPHDAMAYNNRGMAYGDKGDFESAIEDFTKAIDWNPNYAGGYYNRGVIYDKKDNFARAIEDYTKTIELNPDYTEVYYNRGNAYREQGDFDCAIADYIKTIKLKPDYADAYINRGVAYSDKGDVDRAIADYTTAIALNPDFADAYYNRGVVYGKKIDFNRAIEDYTKAIDLKPDFAEPYYNRGEAWLRLGEWENARLDLTVAARLGVNIIHGFRNEYGSVPDFERRNEVKLPADLAAMLTPQ